jgi:hypothetical protein
MHEHEINISPGILIKGKYMFNKEKSKDIVDEMIFAEFVEMNMLRKRVHLFEFKYGRLYPLDIKTIRIRQHEFCNWWAS